VSTYAEREQLWLARAKRIAPMLASCAAKGGGSLVFVNVTGKYL